MTWGTFGFVHIYSLFLSVGINVALYFILKRLPQKLQVLILGILSFVGIGAIIFNLTAWGDPLEYLPLHLCSMNALVLPFAVFTRNKVLNNLLLLWSLGAVLALVVNTAQTNFDIFSMTFAEYYFSHTLEMGIPVLMFALKLVDKDLKCMWTTILITLACYTVIHFINLGINAYCLENNITSPDGILTEVNYMYTLWPENPIMQIFWNILPVPFAYNVFCIPIVFVYLCIVYFPEILAWIKRPKKEV